MRFVAAAAVAVVATQRSDEYETSGRARTDTLRPGAQPVNEPPDALLEAGWESFL
jgi:hypothetical protein